MLQLSFLLIKASKKNFIVWLVIVAKQKSIKLMPNAPADNENIP